MAKKASTDRQMKLAEKPVLRRHLHGLTMDMDVRTERSSKSRRTGLDPTSREPQLTLSRKPMFRQRSNHRCIIDKHLSSVTKWDTHSNGLHNRPTASQYPKHRARNSHARVTKLANPSGHYRLPTVHTRPYTARSHPN
ncbi:uncharacterized protein EI90DRAFT_2328781 [Cantharellus anzutake]|uniref:uncharacterized protein n=1 Tax=Cantharellus anzutake TaxID=1750568 RepID=UPI0019050AAE|nr:uncharacterized protein EI90DRAFT_2328781 [Cantharellus anzutake]KAF8324592.1 hypothetical protein EI90DRAFT_2328781 [Cantharellus anzutake]